MINKQNHSESYINNVLRQPIRKVSFRYDLLNRIDTKIGELDGISKAFVSYGEFREIKRSASFEIDEYGQKEINFLTDQIQPWFILHMPDNSTVEWPLGIFMLESPQRNINGNFKKCTIGAYDKSLVLIEYKLSRRHFIEKGTKYTSAIRQLLNMCGLTKVSVPDSELSPAADLEFPAGTTCKLAVNELLTAINYDPISIDEEGNAITKPYLPYAIRKVTKRFSTVDNSVIQGTFRDTLDLAGRHNVFVRIAKNPDSEPLISKFVNDDPTSPVSTVNRGREIVNIEDIKEVADQDTLDSIVKRIALESASAYRQIRFDTLLMPAHADSEILFMDIPEIFSPPAKFQEVGWSMELSHNGKMRHEARAVIQLG